MFNKKKALKRSKNLKKPTIWRRTQKTWVYNAVWAILFIGIFCTFFTIDELCFELDWFLMYGLADFRLNLVFVGVSFWFAFRSFFKLCNCLRFTLAAKKHEKEIEEKGAYKSVYEGTEGTGKTFNTTNDAFLTSFDAYDELAFMYYLKKPFEAELEGKDDADYKAIKASYTFYERNKDKIPSLGANYKIEYKGREAYSFDMGYFDQTKRPPENLVMALTEVANLLPNSQSRLPKDAKKDEQNFIKKNETLGYCRQWFNMRIYSDEQRGGEIFLGLRSLYNQILRLTARKKVLRPVLLEWFLSRLRAKIMKKGEKNTRFLSRLYVKLSAFIEDIGFYIFSYEERNPETGATKSETNEFVVPCDIPFYYDTRGERSKYRLYTYKPE